MGRYYGGDIEGKFCFGVQDSGDADFFGVEGFQPHILEYYFEQEDLPKVLEGLVTCRKELEKNPDNEEWQARLELGNEIKECIEGTGRCHFTADLT